MSTSLRNIRAQLADISFWLCGPQVENPLLVGIRVLADESHDERAEKVMTFAALISHLNDWGNFWQAWKEVLDRPEFGVGVFHATDCEKGAGVFEGWERDRIESLQKALITVLNDPQYALVGMSVSLDLSGHAEMRGDLKSWLFLEGAVNGPVDDPWFLGFTALVSSIMSPQSPFGGASGVGFIFDQHDLKERAKSIYQVLENDAKERGQSMAGVSFRDRAHIVPLQAADLYAYETFRYRLDTEIEGRPERWHHIALRPITVRSFWVGGAGLASILGGAKASFLEAVPNHKPPAWKKPKIKKPFNPSPEDVRAAEEKRAERKRKRQDNQ